MAYVREKKNAYMTLDDIKMDLNEIGQEDVDRIYLTPDTDTWPAIVNTAVKLQVPQNKEFLD